VKTQFGESFVGEGANAAHVNTVLGESGGPVETAWATALATPRAGHVPFVATVTPGTAVRPFTLFVNKATMENDRHAELTWGAAHAGVAVGVMEAVAEGIVAAADAAELLLIANNKEATLGALRAGKEGRPFVGEALSARHTPSNAYFSAS
jgi:5,6,7,8-tetrahydromethanopterin hydro-lyase